MIEQSARTSTSELSEAHVRSGQVRVALRPASTEGEVQ